MSNEAETFVWETKNGQRFTLLTSLQPKTTLTGFSSPFIKSFLFYSKSQQIQNVHLFWSGHKGFAFLSVTTPEWGGVLGPFHHHPLGKDGWQCRDTVLLICAHSVGGPSLLFGGNLEKQGGTILDRGLHGNAVVIAYSICHHVWNVHFWENNMCSSMQRV